TNRAFLIDLLEHEGWRSGDTHTHFIDEHFPDGWTPQNDSADVQEAAVAAVFADHRLRMRERTHLPQLQAGYRNNVFAPLFDAFSVGDEEISVYYRPVGRRFAPNHHVFDIFAS